LHCQRAVGVAGKDHHVRLSPPNAFRLLAIEHTLISGVRLIRALD
jgi:hypothetical protein